MSANTQADDRLEQSAGNGTVEQKLIACIGALLESAGHLRKALVGRDVEAIWEALGEQEEQAGLLNEYSALWHEMREATGGDARGPGDTERRRIRIEMKRLQALQRANSMLAQSFLSAIRKAIDSVNAAAPGSARGAYSRHGRRRSGTSSRLLRRIG
jgi:hypothetical protein